MITKTSKLKGQAVVIGFVLILALIVSFFAWFQVTQLPEINKQAESEHARQVESDMIDLRTKIWEVTKDSQTKANAFRAETTVDYILQSSKEKFSTAQISFNTISSDAYNFSNTNRTVVDKQVQNTEIVYSPVYFELNPFDTIIENNVVRNTAKVEDQVIGSQLLMTDDEIYISEINTDVRSISSPVTELVIRESSHERKDVAADDPSKDIEFNVDTNISESVWKDQLQDVDSIDGDVEVTGGTLKVPLNGSKEYTVHISRMNLDGN